MELIHQNPFRVLGLCVTATDREIAKQISDIGIYADMGKEVVFDSDNYFSIPPIRTSEAINEAKQRIDQPYSKLFYSMFWFWQVKNNVVDDMAFEELKNGNYEKAISFWERETSNGITSKNVSNYKNLFTLLLGLSINDGLLDKPKFLTALVHSGSFLANGFYVDFTEKVIGNRHTVDLSEISFQFIDEVLTKIKSITGSLENETDLTRIELVDHFKYFPDKIKNGLIEKFIGQHIHKIENQIEISIKDRNEGISTARDTGFTLYKRTNMEISHLQDVLPRSDLKYRLIADKLADELISCSIDYYNTYQNSDIDPGEDSLKLLNYAKSIAVGDKVIDKINEGIPILEEFVSNKPYREKQKPVKNEFDFIYKQLESLQTQTEIVDFPNIAKSFLQSCRPKLQVISGELGIYDENFLELCDVVVGNAMGMCLEFMNAAARVAEEKYQYSDQSKREILLHTLTQVRPTFDLIGDFHMSSSKREEYDTFCDQVGFTNKRTYSQQTTSSSSGCYIATMVYGSYSAPEVLLLRKFRDDVLQKKAIGKWFVINYYKYSPWVVQKTRNKKGIHRIIRALLYPLLKILRVQR